MSGESQNPKNRKNIRREVFEWGIILAIPFLLYVTGLHTEVAGRLQQALLWTGFVQADTQIPPDEQKEASYNMQLFASDGEPIDLKEFEGKVIFLNFWATWCPPCIAEMPSIQQLYEEVGDNRDIAFVMVSLDESFDKAQNFVERKEFTFPIYQLSGARPEVYQSDVIPTAYIIDKKGKIVSWREGMANYHTENFKQFFISLSR